MNLTFQPFLDWPWLTGFAALALGVCIFLFWKRERGAWLRLATGASLLAALANPVLHQEERQPLSDVALLVIDHSESQNLGTRLAQTDKAAADLRQSIAALGNMEIREVTVTSGAGQGQDGTRAFAAMAKAMSDIPANRFAGAIFITDGQIHDVPQSKSLADLKGPLHGLISGSKNESDRRLVIDHAPQFTLVGQTARITFHVEDSNAGSGDAAVTVEAGTDEPRKLLVKPGAAAEVDVDIGHAGENYISLSAELRPGEISADNNRGLAVVQGIRDRLRVLLISGEPNAGERTWRNLLKADSAVDLVHFTILRPPEKQDGTPNSELSLITFPTQELFVDKLNKFDLVIFDRYHRESVLPDAYIANIADYVKQGGALLISSGAEFAAGDGLDSSPLAEVLGASPTGDIIERGYRPKLTKSGERHPVTQGLKGASTSNPTWGRWFRLIDSTALGESEQTEVLMSGPDEKPLLVLRRVEEGRVAQLLSDQGWLWARGYDGGGPQAELLKRIAHWLMKEPELEEERLIARQQGDHIIVERHGLKDDYKPVTLAGPSGPGQDVTLKQSSPGLFTGEVKPERPGLYQVKDGSLQAYVNFGVGDAKEMAELVPTVAKLKPAADAAGGGLFWLQDGLPHLGKQESGSSFAGAGWMNLRANGQFKILSIREIDLFSSLIALAALLLLASFMWKREGR